MTAVGDIASTLEDMERTVERKTINSEDSWFLREAVYGPSLEVFSPKGIKPWATRSDLSADAVVSIAGLKTDLRRSHGLPFH